MLRAQQDLEYQQALEQDRLKGQEEEKKRDQSMQEEREKVGLSFPLLAGFLLDILCFLVCASFRSIKSARQKSKRKKLQSKNTCARKP